MENYEGDKHCIVLKCIEGSVNIDNFVIQEREAGCDYIYNLKVKADENNDANVVVTWDCSESSTDEFVLYYKKAQEHDSVRYDSVIVYQSPYVLENLELNTEYLLFMKGRCLQGQSSKVAYKTVCGTIKNLPYEENFESYHGNAAVPPCWLSNSSRYAPSTYMGVIDSLISGVALRFTEYGGEHGTVMLPLIDTSINMRTLKLSFDLNKIAGADCRLHIGVIKDPEEYSTFEILKTIEQYDKSIHTEVSFASYTGTGRWIAFSLEPGSVGAESIRRIVLDNIVLDTINFALRTVFDTVCQGQSVEFAGNIISQSGVYYDTVFATDMSERDSVISLHLTVLEKDYNVYAEICNGHVYEFNGADISQSGTYTAYLKKHDRDCDSVVTLVLNVNDVYDTLIYDTVFANQQYVFNGNVYNTAGTYTANMTTEKGCDSTVSVALYILPAIVNTQYLTVCSDECPVIWRGKELTQSGVYTDSLIAVSGNDSLEVLNLVVNPVRETVLFDTVCENTGYAQNGRIYNKTGVYIDTLQTLAGCDSVVILNLTVNPIIHDTVWADICTGSEYIFAGSVYTESGTYDVAFISENGCDSLATLILNVNPVITESVERSICAGDSVVFGGKILTKAGIYYDTLQTQAGCDSIIIMTLNLNEADSVYITDTLHSEETYDFNGRILSEAGDYIDTLVNADGCDSVIYLHLEKLSSLYGIGTPYDIRIYPNPAKDFITLEIGHLILDGADAVVIFNSKGQTVCKSDIRTQVSNVRYLKIDVSSFESGVYYIKVGDTVKKLIVE